MSVNDFNPLVTEVIVVIVVSDVFHSEFSRVPLFRLPTFRISSYEGVDEIVLVYSIFVDIWDVLVSR